MAEEKQEGQKTVVSFVVGLLIGGLLVWAFSGPADESKKTDDTTHKTDATESTDDTNKDETPAVKTEDNATDVVKEVVKSTLPVGDGKIVVSDQKASDSIKMDTATYPVSEGWVGVRDYQDGQLGALLGVVRFSEKQGLVPNAIALQRSTSAGKEYAVVVYQENGDYSFNLSQDVQIDKIFSTFTAK